MDWSMERPQVFRALLGEAYEVKSTPYGSVGKLYSSQAVEAVWVSKSGEAIDPEWYSQPTVDLILVMQGKLRVEFDHGYQDSIVLEPGDLLVIPPGWKCRACRWPREAPQAAVFFAVYPQYKNEAEA